jgi:orotate phosphoribosyltransferase-like protein
MNNIDDMILKAVELERNGLNVEQIADELNTARETVTWLLARYYEIKESTDSKIKNIDNMIRKAVELWKHGFNVGKIANELNVTRETATWLLTRDYEIKESAASEIKNVDDLLTRYYEIEESTASEIKNVDDMIRKAVELQRHGLNVGQIADELNVGRETVRWLLTRDYEIKESTASEIINIDNLILKAIDLWRHGFNVGKIADELNVTRETATWLLTRDYKIKESTVLRYISEKRFNHVKKEDLRKEVVELNKETELPFEYDVAVSYASENLEIVKQIAEKLRENNIRVFFDKYEKIKLWGKNLSTHFQLVYGKKSCFVLVFVSKEYSIKDWTNFEFIIARDAAKTKEIEFILPVRLDNTPLVGLKSDIAYLDLTTEGIDGVVNAVVSKINDLYKF